MEEPDEQSAVLAFDVGGANIKAADGRGWAHAEAFPLWRKPDELPAALARIIAARGPRRIVATMTGEIADCFTSRAEGVTHIVAALEAAAGPDRGIGIYLVDGTLASPAAARARPLLAAAANWHALARLAATHATTERAFVIDVGSTTTDVIPIADGAPANRAHDDVARLEAGELVYTGIERTPIAAIVRSLPWPSAGPGRRPVASERYAESRDAWLVLRAIPEDLESCDTADGRPATRAAARARLGRMLLADPDTFNEDDAFAAAAWCARMQARQVGRAIRRVAGNIGWRPRCVILAGHGTCLARRAIADIGWSLEVVSLPDRLGADVSRAACAHAVATIDQGLVR